MSLIIYGNMIYTQLKGWKCDIWKQHREVEESENIQRWKTEDKFREWTSVA